MAFISTGYNPQKPMEGRISDIGPRKYDTFFPPVIAKNFGKWLYHEILEPGVLVHVAESGDKVYTVRCGGARLMSTVHIREICEIATLDRVLCPVSRPAAISNSWSPTKPPSRL